ncbi:MAG: restriction endonuclease subunit S [Deltaproteobacteria bacterium]|nr:restriction endonuclease subunit S [Deltaproteobacteria bacterium]
MAKLARKEGGHSCPPNGGLEKPPSVGDAVQTELGRLPAGWRVMPIREAYSFTRKPRGMVIPRDGSIPFLPMDLIPIGRVSVSEYEERSGSRLTSGTYIENGDLLVAKITPSFENGKQAIVRWDRPFGFATTEVIPIQEIEGVSDKNYLFHVLLHPVIRSDLAGKMDGTTGRQRLSKEVLGSQVITLPPLAEQRKIAGVLGLVQRAMEQQERLIALTTELKKVLLHQLFTQGLRGEPQKQTEIGPVPVSWEVVTLDEYLAEAQYGISAKGSESGRYAVLRMTNQRQGRISSDNLQYVELTPDQFQKFRVERRDILFNRTNSLDLVGRTAIFDLEGDFVFASYLIRLCTDGERLRPFFLNHYFNWEETQVRLKSIATRAISQSNISASRLRGFLVSVPKPEEQDEIVEKVDCLDKKLLVHARKHTALTDLFRTLLHQLMTAQIRVHDLHLPELVQEMDKA